jgi:hypothetical protein
LDALDHHDAAQQGNRKLWRRSRGAAVMISSGPETSSVYFLLMRFSGSLRSEPDRLAAYSGISHSFQLTAKLSSDLAGRAINRRKKIGIGLLDCDFSERQHFRTDPTMVPRRTVRPDSYNNFADTAPEPC